MTVTQFVRKFLTKSLGSKLFAHLKVNKSSVKYFDDYGYLDREGENIAPSNIGTIVDYLTRFLITEQPEECIKFITIGLNQLKIYLQEKSNDEEYWENSNSKYSGYNDYFYQFKKDLKIYSEINKELEKKKLTNNLIIYMCQLVPYNNLYRGGMASFTRGQIPNDITIENIKFMVLRTFNFLKFFENIKSTADFSPEAFKPCKLIDDGDGDFKTDKFLIELKTLSKPSLESYHIYQCIVYYLLYQNQGINLEKIYIVNPRYGCYYETETKLIPKELIENIKSLW